VCVCDCDVAASEASPTVSIGGRVAADSADFFRTPPRLRLPCAPRSAEVYATGLLSRRALKADGTPLSCLSLQPRLIGAANLATWHGAQTHYVP
jgi:hypothetical protein